MSFAAIYLRGEAVIVVPRGLLVQGGGYDAEPAFVVPAEPMAVAQAIEEALVVSEKRILEPAGTPVHGTGPRSVLFKALRVRSWKQFFAGMSQCSIEEIRDGWYPAGRYLIKWVPYKIGRAWTATDDTLPYPGKLLPEIEDLGAYVLDVLKDLPKMPSQ